MSGQNEELPGQTLTLAVILTSHIKFDSVAKQSAKEQIYRLLHLRIDERR